MIKKFYIQPFIGQIAIYTLNILWDPDRRNHFAVQHDTPVIVIDIDVLNDTCDIITCNGDIGRSSMTYVWPL